MKIEFEKSFELPTQKEWDLYLSDTTMNFITVDKNFFNSYQDKTLMYPMLLEEIDALNNKSGNLKISYTLCRHYYDKGIPDSPYFISPGTNGESVQYFPCFREEHWMRLYWFNYFAEAIYTKLFSIWDSVTEILNIFYGMNIKKNMRFKFQVVEQMKDINFDIWKFLKKDILENELYQQADRYRNAFVHYTAPSFVGNSYTIEHEKEIEIPEPQEDGTVKMLRKKATVFSNSVGDYTETNTIVTNLQAFSTFTQQKINELLQKITAQ